VLLDDRGERPGVKFKDADLIGIPLRLTIGGKGLKEGVIELKWRGQKEVMKIPLPEAETRIVAAVREVQVRASPIRNQASRCKSAAGSRSATFSSLARNTPKNSARCSLTTRRNRT